MRIMDESWKAFKVPSHQDQIFEPGDPVRFRERSPESFLTAFPGTLTVITTDFNDRLDLPKLGNQNLNLVDQDGMPVMWEGIQNFSSDFFERTA